MRELPSGELSQFLDQMGAEIKSRSNPEGYVDPDDISGNTLMWLKDNGYVEDFYTHDKESGLYLTEKGLDAAKRVHREFEQGGYQS